MGPNEDRATGILIPLVCLTLPLASWWTSPAGALTGGHQVIVAYYPIFPRWWTPENCLWIGDLDRQCPLLGLYNNRTDMNVNAFDFESMAKAGVTVINVHLFSSSLDSDTRGRLDRIDTAAAETGLMWTPTFESLMSNGPALAAATNAVISTYGPDTRLMRVDGGRPVFFWYMRGVPPQQVVDAVEVVRATHGPVIIIFDEACTMGQPCQNGDGLQPVNPLFAQPDATTGQKRITGFYQWVSVFWAMQTNRLATAANYVNSSVAGGFLPVLCSTPSYNEEDWGYGLPGDNCGVGGDRSHQPHYNVDRSLDEWEANLHDVLQPATAQTWLYIQAYDEWAEGTVLAPTTYGCFEFLARLRQVLQQHGWLSEPTPYCRPAYPPGYAPTACGAAPCCDEWETITVSAFDNAPHGWDLDTWSAGSYGPGSIAWQESDGNPNGCIMAAGSGDTNNDSSCTREGARMTRILSTAALTEIEIHYDVLASLNAPPPAGCTGSCSANLLAGTCEDQLVVSYSTSGTDGPWTVAQVLTEGIDLPAAWTTKTIYLLDVPQAENNSGFAIRFDWQFNTAADIGRLDNVRITGRRLAGAFCADFDRDGDVDQADFGRLQACYSGTGYPYAPGCEKADFDADGAVDQDDLTLFLSCMNGPGVTPGC